MDLSNPIAIGNTATIYHHDNQIIKVFKDHFPETESLKEAHKHRYAYSCGLPVPRIIDLTKINGKQAIIMEHVKGETLGDLFYKDKERAESLLDKSVNSQLAIHQIKPGAIEPMYEKLYRQIEAAKELSKEQKTKLQNKLDSISYQPRLCHGDFHLFNLIQTENQVVVIDWVDASAGDFRADIYRTYLLYSQYSKELAEMYVQLYCDKTGLLKSEVFQWAPVIAGARLAENVSSENAERLLEIVNGDF